VIAPGEKLRLDEDESEQSDQFWTHSGAHHITPFMPLNLSWPSLFSYHWNLVGRNCSDSGGSNRRFGPAVRQKPPTGGAPFDGRDSDVV
jgi:hypothetical protein